jgi:hypothetical protein
MESERKSCTGRCEQVREKGCGDGGGDRGGGDGWGRNIVLIQPLSKLVVPALTVLPLLTSEQPSHCAIHCYMSYSWS